MSKMRYHRSSKHNITISTFGQKQVSPDLYNTISRDPEPQQGYNMRESEQMTLGIANQLEDKSESAVQLEGPIVHDIGLIYVPSSTYRTYETRQWISKNENEQMTLGITNQFDDRKGSTMLVGKPEIHEAPQTALSDQLEQLDSYHTFLDEN